jgi:hypothetical protein
MSENQKGIPWPVWAIVTILCALIAGGYFTFKPFERRHIPDEPDPISGTYLMDNQQGRIIVISRLNENHYRIEESSSPWPWGGEAHLDGGRLEGQAHFRKSQASMNVEGVVRGDKSIEVNYHFITEGDGSNANGRVDHHIWFPQK